MQKNPLQNIAIVLVSPQTGGNIGSVARAMTNMSLSDLRIVQPRVDPFGEDAQKLAHGSLELLQKAKIYATIQESIGNCAFVLGTSHKPMRYKRPSYTAREIGPKILPYCQENTIAILFGREDHGLSNEEIELCTWLINIPSPCAYPTLNLAQAVMVICYELYMSTYSHTIKENNCKLVTFQDLDKYLWSLHELLLQSGFQYKNDRPELFIGILRRLFTKKDLEEHELRVLYKLSNQFRMIIENHFKQ